MGQLVLWDTDVIVNGDGSATLRARKPLCTCETTRAMAILGLPNNAGARRTLFRLRRHGMIRGEKVGAIANRKDGRESNAKIRWDVESLMEHKERVRNAE